MAGCAPHSNRKRGKERGQVAKPNHKIAVLIVAVSQDSRFQISVSQKYLWIFLFYLRSYCNLVSLMESTKAATNYSLQCRWKTGDKLAGRLRFTFQRNRRLIVADATILSWAKLKVYFKKSASISIKGKAEAVGWKIIWIIRERAYPAIH